MRFGNIISLCVLLFAVLEENQSEAFRVTRQGNGLILELLIVVDYSAYEKWYAKTSSSSSTSHRVQEATDNVKQYVSTFIHSSNNVYRSLQSHNLNVQIKLVDVLVMTSASQSPWTENVKVQDADGVTYDVDPTKVFPTFITKSKELQNTIPHDHAMIFTAFSMKKSSGSTFAGYANTKADCYDRGVSIVSDEEGIYTAALMAHELGHSLGAHHDGEKDATACPVGGGYTMEAHITTHTDKKWIFSTCSAASISSYIQYLNTHHKNCLTHIDNSHPDAQVLQTATHEWYGQVYSWDEQCQIHYGPQSYFCRQQYDGNYTGACFKMRCYKPGHSGCYWVDGGDGAPCDQGKWCMSNHCVPTTDSTIQSLSGTCVAGDQPGIAYNGRTCQEIGASHDIDCQKEEVQYRCCKTCADIIKALPTLGPTDIDAQCARKQGPGSYLCRGATAYKDKSYSDIICSRMLCADTTRDHWCLDTDINDKTSCGNRKWCINGACIQDNSAPDVPDDCPWGDQPGVAAHGLTCEQVKLPANHYRCYDSYTYTRCCAACKSIARTEPGCEYGDESHHCHSTSCHTYDATKRQRCCQTCGAAGIIG